MHYLVNCKLVFCNNAFLVLPMPTMNSLTHIFNPVFQIHSKFTVRWSPSRLITKRWARSWSRCTGSQPANDLSHPGGRLTLLSTRPAVTFPAKERHCPSTKLYCLVTEAHRCEQLAEGCYAALSWWELNPLSQVQHLTAIPPRHSFYKHGKQRRQRSKVTILMTFKPPA